MCLKILQAYIASGAPHVSKPLQEYDSLYFPEVLIMILPYLLKSLRHLPILSYNILLILDIICDSSLHQEYAILMEGPHEKLPPVDFLLDIAEGALEQI